VTRGPGTSARRTVVVVCLAFLVSLPAVTTRFYASDEIEFYSWLRSWAFDHDADFANEYQHFYDSGVVRDPGFQATFLEIKNEAGRAPNFAPVGAALLWAPPFAIAHLVAVATGQPADGFSRPYIAAVTYGSACYGFLAVLLGWTMARRLVGRGLAASVIVWIGTPLLFYMYVAPGFGHACSAFAVSLFLWVWLNVRERWSLRGALALGTTGALMAMVREQDALFVIGPALDFAWFVIARRSVDSRRATPAWTTAGLVAAAGTGAFILAYLPQLFAYQALNGHPSPTRLVLRKMTWSSPHFFDVLFSPQHGLFAWTPLAAAAVVGLILLATGPAVGRDAGTRRVAGIALVMFVLQVYVSGSVESWTVAGSFGQRRFIGTTPLLTLGLSALFARSAGWWPPIRRAGLALVILCVWWNLGTMLQFGLHTMDRQQLSLPANARATFVELPWQAPSIAWRYLTDRSSFFKVPRRSSEDDPGRTR
jgi:hypothetical protein